MICGHSVKAGDEGVIYIAFTDWEEIIALW